MRDLQTIDLIQQSLVKGTGAPPEIYIPLWWYSGGIVSTSSVTSLGSKFLIKGSTTTNTFLNVLHTLNASWPSSTKFAFEIAIYCNAGVARAELWDMTSNTAVIGSAVSTGATTATVIRSGQFNLTPGHNYGVTISNDFSADTVNVCDASLIVFPS
jgi:hypothetical protein